jgi:hypothetical protein
MGVFPIPEFVGFSCSFKKDEKQNERKTKGTKEKA